VPGSESRIPACPPSACGPRRPSAQPADYLINLFCFWPAPRRPPFLAALLLIKPCSAVTWAALAGRPAMADSSPVRPQEVLAQKLRLNGPSSPVLTPPPPCLQLGGLQTPSCAAPEARTLRQDFTISRTTRPRSPRVWPSAACPAGAHAFVHALASVPHRPRPVLWRLFSGCALITETHVRPGRALSIRILTRPSPTTTTTWPLVGLLIPRTFTTICGPNLLAYLLRPLSAVGFRPRSPIAEDAQ